MPKRKLKVDRWSGGLLDCPPSIDPDSWNNDNILTAAKPSARQRDRACHCPPQQINRVGGCDAGLRWVEPGVSLEACCHTCGKPLIKGVNKRQDQVLMLRLAAAPIDHLDLADLRACRWLRGWDG